MVTNAPVAYRKAEQEYAEASSIEEKLKALQNMLSTCPKHKSSEKLQKEIKTKIKKYKELLQKIKKSGKRQGVSIKKEGAATICLIGVTKSGKSYLLNRLTDANAKEAEYEFTTLKPEVGALDYKGIKLQVIEIPAIVKDFIYTEKGPLFFSVVRLSDLVVFVIKNENEVEFLEEELDKAEIKKKILIIKDKNDIERIKETIWNNLNLIKVYTKQQGKKPSFPPIALKKGSKVEDVARLIHKDFIKKFRFVRVWGKSARFGGQQFGLDHRLEDDDIVEIHMT